MDYMGEAGNGWWTYGHAATEIWPWNLPYSGDLDICGFKRPQSYYRDVLWNHGSTLGLCSLPGTFPGRAPQFALGLGMMLHPVGPGRDMKDKPCKWTCIPAANRRACCSTAKTPAQNRLPVKIPFIASWQVPYEPGTLTAIGYNQQEEVAHWQLHTAGKPAAFSLTADRPAIQADGQDLCYVTVEVVDANGQRVPRAQNLVRFSVEGEGTRAAVSEIPNLTAWKVSSYLNAPHSTDAAWQFSDPNVLPAPSN